MALKVLMFGWEFPPHNSGGLGTACFGLSRALSHDSEVVFVLPKKVPVNSGFAKMVFANIGSIKIQHIDSLLYPYITGESYNEEYQTHHDSAYGASLIEEVKRYARKAGAIALSENCDVIHAHDWLAYLAGIEAKKATGKPLVVHVHATEFDRTGGQGVNEEVYAIERAGLEASDAVVAVSQWTKDILVSKYNVAPEKVTVVHNGIDIEDAKKLPSQLKELKSAGNKIVLFVGRITMQKGPDYFIRAAKRVLEYRPKTMFVVSGSGDMEYQMIRQAANEGISDRVFFAGFLRGDDLNSVYQSADLYIMPSISEPFGITPLEALANGTPVLISNQSGVSEVLNHALKTDFWDIDDMADKIISTLDHPSLSENLRANGYQEVKKNSWSVAAGKCTALYGKLCH
ncbi:MAG: glycosyltransferase family 4 protein [Candidatus Parcubacteria bacterium]|nr:glycosyltransferase family 4 protein [Candidatus Parcubacteria bacterium]